MWRVDRDSGVGGLLTHRDDVILDEEAVSRPLVVAVAVAVTINDCVP